LAAKKGSILDVHMSSKKRDYQKFYEKIFEVVGGVEREGEDVRVRSRHRRVGSVVDLGCGVNGFSYGYLREAVGDVDYVGVEAAGQLVDQTNVFFKENSFDANAVCGDLFDLDLVKGILEKAKRDRIVFLFQVVDALESVERNFSLKLISAVMKNAEVLVISVPLVSLGGGRKFAVKRKWLMDFLEDNFKIERDFEMFGERIICVSK
jgi:SAM-dependent methyltransferase